MSKINRKELLNALEKVRPGLASTEVVEQATSFAFLEGKVATYNDEISVQHPVAGVDFIGAVKAQELYRLLEKLPEEEIELFKEGNEIRLKAGRKKAGLTLFEEVTMPLQEAETDGKWKPVPDGMMEGLAFSLFSCARSSSMPVLSCVHVTQEGTIESSDNHRVTQYFASPTKLKPFAVPATSVKAMERYDFDMISQSPGWVHLKSKQGTVFSSRIFGGNYPDIQKAGIMKVDGIAVIFPQSIDQILTRAQVFCGQNDEESVTVSLSPDTLQIQAKTDSGWFKEETRAKYKGEPVQFRINPTFLQQITKTIRKCILGETKIKFIGDNWEHVISLVG